MSPATAETADASFALSSIGQIAITVTNLERAVAFYGDTLGLKLLFQVQGLAFFDCGGIRLMLSYAEAVGEQYSSVLYFRVPDILAAAKTLESRGAPFDRLPHLVARMPDHDLWMAFFRDPDRNLLALMSEVKRAAE
ncbi:MAG: VOC family protein [Bryobacteraceae bacterium]|jgi:methylmalonyl-CoA/ethylmalonyl-CoA epimerase